MTKILIVDDDDGFLESARSWLELNGYLCTSASSAEEAKRAFDLENPDCCIFDIQLIRRTFGDPTTDGVKLFQQIKERVKKCRAVFVSAYSDYKEDYLLRLGGSCLIEKDSFTKRIGLALQEAFYPRVLLIENDADFALSVVEMLEHYRIRCVSITNTPSMKELIAECDLLSFEVLIIDAILDMVNHYHGWNVLELVPDSFPKESVFFLTGMKKEEIENEVDSRYRGFPTKENLLSALSKLSEDQVLDKHGGWLGRIQTVCQKIG